MGNITEEEEVGQAIEALNAIKADGTKEEIEKMNIILKRGRDLEIEGYEKKLNDLEEERKKLMLLIDSVHENYLLLKGIV